MLSGMYGFGVHAWSGAAASRSSSKSKNAVAQVAGAREMNASRWAFEPFFGLACGDTLGDEFQALKEAWISSQYVCHRLKEPGRALLFAYASSTAKAGSGERVHNKFGSAKPESL